MRRPLLRLQRWLLFVLLLSLLLFVSGIHLRWMSKMPSWMVIFKKRSTWSPRAWFIEFFDVLTFLGFHHSHQDPALFLKCTFIGCILLALYVDDMIITSYDVDGISMLKSNLGSCFKIKDLGALRYFFGIKVASSQKSYLLSQSKYTINILNWARLTDTKTVDNPLWVNVRYSSFDGKPLLDRALYRTIVSNLVYLTIRYSDIAYDVHIVSQFVDSLTTVYWVAILCILRYLWGIIF